MLDLELYQSRRRLLLLLLPSCSSSFLLLPPPPASSAASSSPGSGSAGPQRYVYALLRVLAHPAHLYYVFSGTSMIRFPGSRGPSRTSTVYDFRTPVGLAGPQLYTVSALPWACPGLNDIQFPSISGLPGAVPGLNYKYVEISGTCPKKIPQVSKKVLKKSTNFQHV